MTEKLSVIMNMVTTELQTSCKSGISTLDMLSIINRQIKTDENETYNNARLIKSIWLSE